MPRKALPNLLSTYFLNFQNFIFNGGNPLSIESRKVSDTKTKATFSIPLSVSPQRITDKLPSDLGLVQSYTILYSSIICTFCFKCHLEEIFVINSKRSIWFCLQLLKPTHHFLCQTENPLQLLTPNVSKITCPWAWDNTSMNNSVVY